METNYRMGYDNEWNTLKKRNPVDVADRLGIRWQDEEDYFDLPFCNENYRLYWNDELVLDSNGNALEDFEHAIMLLNYLAYSSEEQKVNNDYTTLKELPGGGAVFYPAFYRYSILPIGKSYGNDLEGFLKKGQSIGGELGTEGDGSFILQVFPKVRLKFILWLGDDELTPEANILFNQSIVDVMHIVCVIGLGSHLSKKLISLKEDDLNNKRLEY